MLSSSDLRVKEGVELAKAGAIDTVSPLDIIDYVTEKLLAQGCRCEVNESCVYSDGEGSHCAVGWLIPDGHAAMAYNGGYTGLVGEYPDLWFVGHGPLLIRLQRIHDSISVGEWAGCLKKLREQCVEQLAGEIQ